MQLNGKAVSVVVPVTKVSVWIWLYTLAKPIPHTGQVGVCGWKRTSKPHGERHGVLCWFPITRFPPQTSVWGGEGSQTQTRTSAGMRHRHIHVCTWGDNWKLHMAGKIVAFGRVASGGWGRRKTLFIQTISAWISKPFFLIWIIKILGSISWYLLENIQSRQLKMECHGLVRLVIPQVVT